MKRKAKGWIAAVTALALITGAMAGLTCYYQNTLPGHYYTAEAMSDFRLNGSALTVRVKKGGSVQTSLQDRTAEADLMLCGILPIQSVTVKQQKPKTVALGGGLFGIKLYTEGVLVVQLDAVTTSSGKVSPGKKAGLKIGDSILSADGKKCSSNEELREIISASGGKVLDLIVLRDGKEKQIALEPVKCSAGIWRGGIWVRDSTAGIGTLTCFDAKTGAFAGLGHGIVDVDAGTLMQIGDGEICGAVLTGVQKGENGTPGQLQGVFTDTAPIGKLLNNTDFGVYGRLAQNGMPADTMLVPVAYKQEVKPGKAYLYCNLDGESKAYEAVIEKVDLSEGKETKNLVIRVTDKALLEKTGGIVQGMSGTPILQNGKLVGAVTHVFVNDAAKGYGILAEYMVENLPE